jgi:glycosyltransferase involved in cell wall biosynthesis
MVLLIGNYALDQQHSMQRFGELMLAGLRGAGVDAALVRPEPVFGKIFDARGIGKWLAYIDKYILFPFRLRRQLSRGPSVVHICDHSNATYVPRKRSMPFVVTCHDLLAVRGGLGEETDSPASFTGRFLQRWILRGLHRADAVVCVSNATATDARRLVRNAKIDIVPLALNFDYRKIPVADARAILQRLPNFDVDLPFALHVGSNLRRKNRATVLRIFARTRDQWNGRLVFAGEPLNEQLNDLAKQLGISDRVVQIDNPTPEILRALYSTATALLFPSRFEGFGWPIIEAQACGCPVICSNTGPMPEAAGAAGLLHNVEDEEGFAADLLRLTNADERARWSEKSLQNAQRFSRDVMIARYIDIYRELGAKL